MLYGVRRALNALGRVMRRFLVTSVLVALAFFLGLIVGSTETPTVSNNAATHQITPDTTDAMPSTQTPTELTRLTSVKDAGSDESTDTVAIVAPESVQLDSIPDLPVMSHVGESSKITLRQYVAAAKRDSDTETTIESDSGQIIVRHHIHDPLKDSYQDIALAFAYAPDGSLMIDRAVVDDEEVPSQAVFVSFLQLAMNYGIDVM